MSNIDPFPDRFPMLSESHSKITSGIFHGLDNQKIHTNVPNGFEFGRADDGVFDSPGGGSEMVGHNVAGPDQFGRLVKAESRGWTGEYVD